MPFSFGYLPEGLGLLPERLGHFPFSFGQVPFCFGHLPEGLGRLSSDFSCAIQRADSVVFFFVLFQKIQKTFFRFVQTLKSAQFNLFVKIIIKNRYCVILFHSSSFCHSVVASTSLSNRRFRSGYSSCKSDILLHACKRISAIMSKFSSLLFLAISRAPAQSK